MDRRNFVKAVALAPLVAGGASFSLASVAPAGPGKGTAAMAHRPMRERYELTLKRVLSGGPPEYTEQFVLADAKPVAERRFTEYSGDVSGRYIGALATAALVYQTKFPKLDELVEKTIALQKPEGYFGSGFNYEKPTDHDLALLWGNGRLLVGLIEYYNLKPSASVLTACKRLGDFMVRIGPLMLSKEIRDAFGAQHFASSYICWMQQTEGLANLYMVTKDERYRKLAAEIAAVIERRPSDHVHGYLSSMRGVMDLYKATSDAGHLRQCEAAWQDVAQSPDSLITGGVPEGWSPNGHRTEGCAEADWLRFGLSLWKATGNPKYLQMAERTVFNELAFNQYATGDFGHRVYTETGLPADGAVRAWWCCSLHGLRAFPDIHASVFRIKDGAVHYDLPVDGRVETSSLSAVAESSLAQDGTIRIRFTAAKKAAAALRMRKPEWTDAVKVRLNGKLVESPLEGGYVGIERPWVAGDVVEVNYAMRLRSEPSGKERVSYFYGPWLLGAAASDNFAYFNELTDTNRLIRGSEKTLAAEMATVRPFSVPIAATVFQCTPAEYWDQPATVTLRAIAEQAGQATTSWELRFLTKEV